MYKIFFITHHHIDHDLRGELNSSGPSARLRILKPVNLLKDVFQDIHIRSYFRYPIESEDLTTFDNSIVIVSKIIRPDQLDLVVRIKKVCRLLIADFCDNYFEGGEHELLQKRLLGLADILIGNTLEMVKQLSQLRNHRQRCYYVPDALPSDRTQPYYHKSDSVRFVTYGNRLVCNHLNLWLCDLEAIASETKVYLEVVTRFDRETIRWFDKTRNRLGTRVNLSFTSWNEFAVESALVRNDIVLIPSDIADNFNKTKSINRLAEGINAGRYVFASPISSYLPFTDLISIGNDLTALWSEFSKLSNVQVEERIDQSQKRLAILFNNAIVKFSWIAAITDISGEQNFYSPDSLSYIFNSEKLINVSLSLKVYSYIQSALKKDYVSITELTEKLVKLKRSSVGLEFADDGNSLKNILTILAKTRLLHLDEIKLMSKVNFQNSRKCPFRLEVDHFSSERLSLVLTLLIELVKSEDMFNDIISRLLLATTEISK
jgi:hypothetical protein